MSSKNVLQYRARCKLHDPERAAKEKRRAIEELNKLQRRRVPWLTLAGLGILLAAVVACAVVDPTAWTPSSPQLTAGALNATYTARATETARPGQSSTPYLRGAPTGEAGTLSVTPGLQPSATFTSSIIEVTARSIVEVTP